MNNTVITLKIKQRLNKLDSKDYDNIEVWQLVEAFNKAQSSWCRRQLHGMNSKQEGDEQGKRRIDDLQVLLKSVAISFNRKDRFVESTFWPADYFQWKRLNAKAVKECCSNDRHMVVYLTEEANVELLLRDNLKKPSFEWGETFCTLRGNKILLYTNNEFTIDSASLLYYRQPKNIQITGVRDPNLTSIPTKDIDCEFKDDIIELFVDEAVKILAGDLESHNQQQTANTQVETNN